jgi:methyltransferase (TIGR00027 family)
MQGRKPSHTALRAAVYRAAHQTLEGGAVFADPFACAILGADCEKLIAEEAADPRQRAMRHFIVARSRFAEDALARAVSRGVRQAVVLGAGLDTFALRNPHAGLSVFEVDYPATQEWKRERLQQTGLAIPASLIFAPVDFERQGLAQGLRDAGFQADAPAFFLWLGVVPYLTREAIFATLDFVAGIPESEIVFDYSEPLESYPLMRRAMANLMAARVAAIGEPWLSHFEPAELHAILRAKGFSEIEDLGLGEIGECFFQIPKDDSKRTPGGHLIRARRV